MKIRHSKSLGSCCSDYWDTTAHCKKTEKSTKKYSLHNC